MIVTCSHNCIILREKSPQQVQAMHLRDAINSAVTAAVWNTWHEHRRVCFYYLCCLCMISVAKQRLESDLCNINPPVIDSHNFGLEMYFLAPSSTFCNIFEGYYRKERPTFTGLRAITCWCEESWTSGWCRNHDMKSKQWVCLCSFCWSSLVLQLLTQIRSIETSNVLWPKI